MSDVPVTDWDMIYRWEWFRHEDWRHDFRDAKLGQGGGTCRAFTDLSKLIGAEVALDCSCGLGLKTICMSEMGLNVSGSDGSGFAVKHAAELAKLEGTNISFFQSKWANLPKNMPHHFDAIFCDALSSVTTWDELGASLVGFYHSLNPGGFLMFMGAGDESDPEEEHWKQHEEWDTQPREYADWFYRDGGVSCSKVVQKRKSEDYIDERYLYVICENQITRLESTTYRRPAYWSWQHWKDLTQMAGFCHLETRTYERYGYDGGPIRVNVAWKEKNGAPRVDHAARNAPYSE
ncbi:MAG: class I SAM-dependent methyltransferase [Planctomycetes bacterium]|nr:class I SAM-dependent methyltransferase [Planctomycetota bacterium]